MIVNLTPHELTIYGHSLATKRIPASGTVARVSTVQEVEPFTVDGENLVRTTFGEVEGLPAPVAGTWYVVSAMVLSRVTDRPDVVAPDTGPTAERDASGKILGVRRFTH